MNLTNYHSHCNFCDGRAPLELFVQAAIAEGFTSYGVSSHAPLPFPTAWTMEWERLPDYLAEARRLKQLYAGQIELYTGLEIDYLNEESHPGIARFQELPLDYRIGSVHFIPDEQGSFVDIDLHADKFKELVENRFQGDLNRVIQLYYGRLLQMVEKGGFDVVGHADKMHYNATCYRPGLLDEPAYDDLVCHYFETIARRDYMVEINTKSFHPLGTFFPNERYFRLLKELGVRVQVNSDAHDPERINSGRSEALKALWKAGYREVMELHQEMWQPVPIQRS